MADELGREQQIADHIARYGLTTLSALGKMVLPDASEKALSRLTERLVASKWLVRRRLPGGGRYFTLGEAAITGEGRTFGRPFGYQALVGRVGVLHFCAKIDVDVMTSAEFRAKFPELAKPGLPTTPHYIDRGDLNRLAYIHVDHGRTSERLVTKLSSRVVSRYRDEDFAGIIQQDRFLIAIATATEEKARAVRVEMEGRGPCPVRIRVEAVPELLSLLIEGPPRRRGVGDA